MNTITLNLKNLVTESATEGYIASFKAAFSKTAKSVLEIGRIVYQAKSNLKSEQYELFAIQIGFKSSSSTLQKLITIGSKYDLLIENVELLPANWTTLYDIAQLPTDKFEQCVDQGLIQPNLKGKEIKPLLPNYNPSKQKLIKTSIPYRSESSSSQYKLALFLGSSPDQETVEKLKKIIKECKTIKFAELDISTLEEFLQPEIIEAQVA